MLTGRAAPAVELRDVGVRYGETAALRAVSAAAEPGSLVSLVGPNGAGKSSLLKAVLGTVRTSGAVSVCGETSGRRRRLLAYVPQRGEVDWHFPIDAMDVVMMGRLSTLRRVGPARERDRAAALRALERVGMAGARRRLVGELSGGQQQRVVLARALFAEAPVLLLDEPFAGVDPGTREVMLGALRDLCDAGGTVLMATHDVAESARIADRVWGVGGTIVADVPACDALDTGVLRTIYGDLLLVLPGGRTAIRQHAR